MSSSDLNTNPHVWNGYMIFVQIHRHRLWTEHPEYTVPQLGRKLGEMWRKLSNNERCLYNQMARLCPDEHLQKMKQELGEIGNPSKEVQSHMSRYPPTEGPSFQAMKKELNTNPHVWNGYMIFVQIHRHRLWLEHPEYRVPDLGRKLGQMWRALSSEERCLYNQMAKLCPDMPRIRDELGNLAVPPSNIVNMFSSVDRKRRRSSSSSKKQAQKRSRRIQPKRKAKTRSVAARSRSPRRKR